MKKAELIELARKNGVTVMNVCGKWWADITKPKNLNLKIDIKLSTLIKFLSDNNIKINN